KSRRTTPQSQERNCSYSGRLSPSWARSLASSCGLMSPPWSPPMTSKATSPGIMFMSRKITNAAPMSVGIISSMRLAMYCHILFPSLSLAPLCGRGNRAIGMARFRAVRPLAPLCGRRASSPFPSTGSASYTAHPQAHSDLFSTSRLRMDRLLYLPFLWIPEKFVIKNPQKPPALPAFPPPPPQRLEQWLDGSTQLRGLLRMLPGQVVLLALEVQGRQGDVRLRM